MSFNGQPNMFFGNFEGPAPEVKHFETIEFYFFCQMVKKMSYLLCSRFFQNFKTLKFLYDSVFHQIYPMNMYFHRKGHVFIVHKF
jgi:hypothetical protein